MNEATFKLLMGIVKVLTRIAFRHLQLDQGEKTHLNLRWRLLEEALGKVDDKEAD